MAQPSEKTRSEYFAKLERLGSAVRAAGIHTVVLRRQGALSWLFGARSHVPYTLENNWFDAVVDVGSENPSVRIVVNGIEAPRLRDTELSDFEIEWTIVPWWESREEALPTGAGVGTDKPYGDVADLSDEVATVRRVLDEAQAEELRQVCKDSAFVATEVAIRLSPHMTEYEAAGLMTEGLLARGMEPVTILVAGGDRGGRHRHPLPLDRPLGDRAMLVLCGRRAGLISAVTRIVSFQPVSDAVQDSYSRLLEVEANFLDASVPGLSIGEAFSRGISGYEQYGFEPQEWHRHHQGGFSGWESREYPAHVGSSDMIESKSVIAWNPTADGLKVEDTVLVTTSGPELLVHDALWPMMNVRGRLRPAILEV